MCSRSASAAAILAALAGSVYAQPSAVPFPAAFELADLLPANGGDGSLGFVINGIDSSDYCGSSVSSAGDVNGDGVDDLVIGAFVADQSGRFDAGETYVVFGGPGVGFGGSLHLASLDGTNGFVLRGIDIQDWSGTSVSSAGDINGDGVDDLIIGAPLANPNGKSNAGESYVVFGGPGVGAGGSLDLASLGGTNGFVLNGIDASDTSGESVSSAGDVNGDGVGDLIVGAPGGSPNGQLDSGESYVVFGGPDVGAGGSLDLASLDGTNGFVLNGIDADDYSGESVSSAGDVNGDGVDDLIIGAPRPNTSGQIPAGESYVVFGGPDVGAGGSLDLASLDGSNGFVLNGIDEFDRSGLSVSSAGDVNGDGVGDLIVGAPKADPNGLVQAGESYVVFGGSGVGAGGALDLAALDGANGFVLNGIGFSYYSGASVSAAGDLDGDGVDDLLIGALLADPNGEANAGESYVVFGDPGIGASGSLELASLDGANGFVLNGIDLGDRSGRSVSSAGDINADGVDDVIIGARNADPGGLSSAGEAYVLFGRLTNARVWTNPAGGNLALPANWQDSLVPGPADTAVIDNVMAGSTAGAFSILQPSPQSIRSLLARTDDVTLNLNGHPLALGDGAFPTGGGLTVGGRSEAEARLRLINSQLLQVFATTDDVVIGPGLTSEQINPLARLTIEGGAAGLDIARQLVVGDRASDAQCWILAGAEATVGGELLVALHAPSGGQLRIDQGGSELTLDAPAERTLIGGRGVADVQITNGGGLETTTILDSTVLAENALSSATVTIDGLGSRWISAQQDLIIADAGQATLTIANGAELRTDTTNQLVVARQPGSSAEIILDGLGSNWTELSQSIAVGGEGDATVHLRNGASIASLVGINVRSLGRIAGDGAINAPNTTSFGGLAPGDDQGPGTIQINGSYRQTGLPPGGAASAVGAISVDVFGAAPGQCDEVVITGDAELAGALRVSFAGGFTPDPETLTDLQLFTAGTNFTDSRFDVALLPSLGDSSFFSVEYGTGVARDGSRSTATVSLQVNPLTGDLELDPQAAGDSGAAGTPQGATLGDIDMDGDPDLLIALPDATNPETANGSIVILYNANDGDPGNGWEGFGPVLQITAGVGVNPSAVAVGNLDGDAQPDIAIANRGDTTDTNPDTISVLLITDGNPPNFGTSAIFSESAGDQPADVIIADLDGDGLNDLAAPNAGSGSVTVSFNNGFSIGGAWERVNPSDLDLPDEDECPLSIRPGETSAGLRFLATANTGADSIGLIQINPDQTTVVLPNIPAGDEPIEIIVRDLDGDGSDDVATANRAGSSVSIALNQSTPGAVALGAASELPIDTTVSPPSSITAGDYDADGDNDVAVLADGVVKVLRNDLTAGQLAFTPIADQAAGADPLLLRTGDLNVDGEEDVVSVAESTGAKTPGDPINTLLAIDAPGPACAGDVNGDGTTDVFDFADLAANFGAGPGATRQQGDLTSDGFVDVFDFGELAGDFGCGGAP